MRKSIVHVFRDSKWVSLKEAGYIKENKGKNEKELQDLICNNPNLLKKDIFIIKEEFPTGPGSADAVAIDKAGQFYVIEVKLAYSSDKKNIIAQLIRYGSTILFKALAYPEVKKNIEEKWFESFLKRIDGPLNGKFESMVKERFNFSDLEYKNFFDNFKKNLLDHRITYCVVMDEVDEELINSMGLLHEYSNDKCNLLIFQIKKYIQSDSSTVYCTIIDQFQRDPQYFNSGSKRSKWNFERFMEEVISKFENDKDCAKIRDLTEWSKRNFNKIGYGTGGIDGSFNPKLDGFSQRSVFSLWSTGDIVFNFGWLNDSEEIIRKTEQLRSNLTKIFPNMQTDMQFPRIPFDEWKQKINALKEILSTGLKLKTHKINTKK